MSDQNLYGRIIEHVFHGLYGTGASEVPFDRDALIRAARELGVPVPKNVGDLIYSFRYRTSLPESVRDRAPDGKEWIIRPAGKGRYRFVAVDSAAVLPNERMSATKVPDATPGVIAMYALNDEQALLAKLRYNRLVDVFTGADCYSLQNHLRTTVPDLGQVETDEVYVGIDRKGVHHVLPVQAKGGRDRLSVVQIEQDMAMCAAKFPDLVCRPIGAQFPAGDLIALFEFETSDKRVGVVR
jgi:hypothetical protein